MNNLKEKKQVSKVSLLKFMENMRTDIYNMKKELID